MRVAFLIYFSPVLLSRHAYVCVSYIPVHACVSATPVCVFRSIIPVSCICISTTTLCVFAYTFPFVHLRLCYARMRFSLNHSHFAHFAALSLSIQYANLGSHIWPVEAVNIFIKLLSSSNSAACVLCQERSSDPRVLAKGISFPFSSWPATSFDL